MAKSCYEEIKIGDKTFCCHREPPHNVHEHIGTAADAHRDKVLIQKFVIEWAVTEMEIE